MPTQPKLEFKSTDSSKLDKNLKVIALYDKKCDKITKKKTAKSIMNWYYVLMTSFYKEKR